MAANRRICALVNHAIIGTDNGLSRVRFLVMLCAKDDLLSTGTSRKNFSEIRKYYNGFHSRQCISICRLRTGGHFGPNLTSSNRSVPGPGRDMALMGTVQQVRFHHEWSSETNHDIPIISPSFKEVAVADNNRLVIGITSVSIVKRHTCVTQIEATKLITGIFQPLKNWHGVLESRHGFQNDTIQTP